MSRLFITQREQNLISDITKELIRDIAGQTVYYYPVSELKTKTNELYNEATNKVWDTPVQLPALVSSPDSTIKTDIFGPDQMQKLEVYIQYRDAIDIGININIGDFLRYGDTMFEIVNVSRMRNIYGHVEQLDGFKLECAQSRKGQIDSPQIGPSDVVYSDPTAVQKDFTQTRGFERLDGEATGDKRDLRKNGVLEEPVSGPAKVVEQGDKGSDFYGEKW